MFSRRIGPYIKSFFLLADGQRESVDATVDSIGEDVKMFFCFWLELVISELEDTSCLDEAISTGKEEVGLQKIIEPDSP